MNFDHIQVGYLPQPGQVVYGVAKAGLDAAVRGLATELGPSGTRVVGLAPGTIDTPLLDSALAGLDADERDAALRSLGAATALGRIGSADEVASVIAFLASPAAGYITGTTVLVDGGYLALKSPPERT